MKTRSPSGSLNLVIKLSDNTRQLKVLGQLMGGKVVSKR